MLRHSQFKAIDESEPVHHGTIQRYVYAQRFVYTPWGSHIVDELPPDLQAIVPTLRMTKRGKFDRRVKANRRWSEIEAWSRGQYETAI